ncbi:hypothetical protein [Parvularcula maris]|uniref:Uncharacterized protein n=1 Tax=Parvularcula maris TaxID=2965077 RepID=A0A9X2RKS3_9PROT|nr:hypothetical protein [Parvularcula maris]MCQ8186078.1 hypothetical protein [Parvularcula maris]
MKMITTPEDGPSRRMRQAAVALGCAVAAWTALAHADEVPMAPESFSISDSSVAEFKEIEGREALCLEGDAFLTDHSLRSGSITVDVLNSGSRAFAQLIFGGIDEDNFETAYARLHKSGQPDALQYTPILNGESNWQLLRDEQAVGEYGKETWTTLRLDFTPHGASLRAGDQGLLKVDHLRLNGKGSKVGLKGLFSPCFSRLQVVGTANIGDAANPSRLRSEGSVQRWGLSATMPFAGFPPTLSKHNLSNHPWTVAEVDPDGTLFISRYRRKQAGGAFEENEVDVVYAGLSIDSVNDTTIPFSFDLSDKGAVYLNGRLLLVYDNSFRAKGPMFRGDFNLQAQTLLLPLQAGRNDLVIGIAERANGWGLAASFLREGSLKVEPLLVPHSAEVAQTDRP